MKIYHGSKIVVDKPIRHGSNKNNDYGPAFYMTRDLKSAKEWACRNNIVGLVNEYVLNISNLKILDLREYNVLHWLAILMHFRELENSFVRSFSNRLKFLEENYYIDVEQYDVVIGYRADDAYFRFPLDFIRWNLTLEQLEYSFKLGNLGVQYALISERAFKRLKYLNSYECDQKYIGSYFYNVSETTKIFDSLSKDEDGTRIIDLMRDTI